MKQLLKYILSLNIEHQKIAETKHSITIALASGVLVVFVSVLDSVFVSARYLGYVAVFNCILSIACSFVALSSKDIIVKRKHKWGKQQVNLTYFKHLSHLDIDEFKQLLLQNYELPQDYKIDNFENDLIKQVLALSKRVNSKYDKFNISLGFLFVSIVCGFVGALIGVV